jgi:hypothetical protein
MKTESQGTVIEQVRALKEENAAEHGFCLEPIIKSARQRQETSGREIVRLRKGDQVAGPDAGNATG